jgi:hypothetical protein
MRLFKTILCQLLVICVNSQKCFVNNDVVTIDGVESEQAGIDFLTQLHGHDNWKQTSYNNNFRGVYAGIGYAYDDEADVFIAPEIVVDEILPPEITE